MNMQGYKLYQTENYFINNPHKVGDAIFIYNIDIISEVAFINDYGVDENYKYEDYCFFTLRDNLLRSDKLDDVINDFKIEICNNLSKTWLTA